MRPAVRGGHRNTPAEGTGSVADTLLAGVTEA
jgi:hypothetical protein